METGPRLKVSSNRLEKPGIESATPGLQGEQFIHETTVAPIKSMTMKKCKLMDHNIRDQARGRLGRNSRPRGRNFALNGTQGEVGVSLKKKKKKNFFFFFFFFFIRETHFHSVTTQMQAVLTLSDNLLPLLPLNGNSMSNGLFASKLTENDVILRYNFSLSDCHFSLIFLQGEVTSP